METGWFCGFSAQHCDGKSSALRSAFVVLEEEFKMARCGLVFIKDRPARKQTVALPQVEKENIMEKKRWWGGGRLKL